MHMHDWNNYALSLLARSDRFGAHLMRIAIAIVFLWIGALKFVPYEADSITPFVARSPLMSFFYEKPDEYKAHLTREGELKPAERAWQTANNTYGFSRGLGTFELIIGLLKQPSGATLTEIMAATGWQAHSVRGFICTQPKRLGFQVESFKRQGERVYRIR